MKKLLAGMALLLWITGCRSPQPGGEQEVASAADADWVELPDSLIQRAGILSDTPSHRVMHATLRVNGTVDVPPQNIVSVSFPVGGYLKQTDLLPGMHINRGDVIGWMEDQSIIQRQQEYLVARSRLNYLEKELQRQQTLRANEVNAAKTLQLAEADYESQMVMVRSLAQQLKLIGIDPAKLTSESISRSVAIHSPITGFVSRVNVNIGKYVNPTDVLFELINPDDMHAALTVFEKDMPNVRIGQRVRVNFVDNPGTTYECEVILVTRNVDEDRSGTVHCHFETRPKNLLPGMFLNAAIEMETKNCLAVPEPAIVRYGESEYVFVESNRGYRLIPVEPGFRDAGWVALEGFPDSLAGRKLVVQNAYTLLGQLKNTAN